MLLLWLFANFYSTRVEAVFYVDIEEIDPCMLRELIKAIYVEAPDKFSGKRRQKIYIQYDGISFIPL